MLIAGIDEAGYGPVLGPLAVTGTAFEVPDDRAGVDLWDILSASVCRATGRNELRLPIADSKKLFARSGGIVHLERAALVMLHTADRQPRTLRGLLQVLAPAMVPDLDEYPWYRDFDLPLPLSTTPADIGTRANAVRRDLVANTIELRGVYSELLCAGHFNRLVEQTHNKATVLLRLALRIAQRIVQRSSGQVRIVIDRHGGREHYVEKLLTFFQGAELAVNEESGERSAYTLTYGRRQFAIEFRTKGEDHHLPVALASVFSKYLRELMVHGLNAFFSARASDLKPTAGYYTDAQRYLADIGPIILNERIDRAMLVRSR